VKFGRRKDGQFSSGGLLVGDRPFFLLFAGIEECASGNHPIVWSAVAADYGLGFGVLFS
jgi:hypothetical protein